MILLDTDVLLNVGPDRDSRRWRRHRFRLDLGSYGE